MKVFVPFSEEMLSQSASLGELGELVPYQMDYRCVRVKREAPKAPLGIGNPAIKSSAAAITVQAARR